jgi:glycosyltransferase involved in cell wall biosynthesis
MKILHYINNLGSGGAEKLLTDILPLMKKEGYDVSLVISNSNRNMNRHEEVFKSNGIKIIDLNTSFYNPLQIISLIKLINRDKYDIVHGHLFPSQYWLGLVSFFISKNIKLIKTEHNASNNRRNYKLIKILDRIIYSKYDLIISITNKVDKNLLNWLNRNLKTRVINNGVNLNEIKDAQIIQYINAINLNNIKSILMVGSFDFSKKNQMFLLQVLKFLPNDYRVFFAGEGPNLANVKLKVEHLELSNRVIFLGVRSDVYRIIKSVDINILSSFHEGLSGYTLESLASGKPFLGSNVEGIKEIVPDTTFLFENDNAKDLAFKIQNILNDENHKQQMIKKAIQHIIKFDVIKMAGDYMKAYKSELSNN